LIERVIYRVRLKYLGRIRKGGHPEHLVGNVVRPGPFGRPPWLGVTLMKCANHRQDSYPDNVGHWRCSVALGVLLTKVSARLRKEPTNTFGKSQPRSRQYQNRPEIDAGIGNVLNSRKQCRCALRPRPLGQIHGSAKYPEMFRGAADRCWVFTSRSLTGDV